VAGHDSFGALAPHFQRVRDLPPLERLLYVDLKTWLANDIRVKVDRMSMANSLEVRAALLDHKVIEFAAGLPTELKYRTGTSKYLLKRYVAARLPRLDVPRPKQGFVIPVALSRGYFRTEAVRRLWQDRQRGARNHGSRLWALMVLELWHRTLVDRTSGDGGAD
jgi:asparagine synthase (glutamine-hydrolysing)